MELSKQYNTEIIIIGGESIYRQFLPFADKMYLTIIEHEFTGDAYFPVWSQDDWQIVNKQKVTSEIYPYTLITLHKIHLKLIQ